MDSPPSIEDEDLLDEVNTPNTFGRGLIQRLGIAEAEAISTFLNNNNTEKSISTLENQNNKPTCLYDKCVIVSYLMAAFAGYTLLQRAV